jgi:glycopeptide antibiotics resistance protein
MYNLYPLKTISEYFTRREHYNLDIIVKNLLGNLLMLVPLGILMPMMFKRFRKTINFLVFILIFNLSIEILQITIKLGSFDVDDIILNCSGAIVAYGIIRLLLRIPLIYKTLETTMRHV